MDRASDFQLLLHFETETRLGVITLPGTSDGIKKTLMTWYFLLAPRRRRDFRSLVHPNAILQRSTSHSRPQP
jgi:hypothetical protein